MRCIALLRCLLPANPASTRFEQLLYLTASAQANSWFDIQCTSRTQLRVAVCW
jgi:hypothetical protein